MKTNRRVLVLSSTYPRWPDDHEPGFVHQLARRLTASYEIHVLCPHAPGAKTFEQLDNVTVHRYRYAPERWETLVQDGGILSNIKTHPWKRLLVPLLFFAQFVATYRVLARIKPDVIHAHWIVPQGLVYAILSKLRRTAPPMVITSHGADLFGLQMAPFRSIKRFSLKRASHIAVVSLSMVQRVTTLGVSCSQVSVLPMGVDFDTRFTPDKSVRRSSNEILFVGRLVEKKGLHILLEAFRRARQQRSDITLTVAGYGPDEKNLAKFVTQNSLTNCVEFLGAVKQEDLAHYYRRASLLVAPFVVANNGDQEGLGLVVVEALACECPVLVSDLPAVSDILDRQIDHEFLFPPNNSSILSEKIRFVLDNQDIVAEQTRILRERIKARFSWTSVTETYSRLLEQSIAETSCDKRKD